MTFCSIPTLRTGRMVVAMIHAMSRCRESEQKQIAVIRDSRLPIREWWSYLHLADRARMESYAPERTIRHSYAPELGYTYTFQAAPIGDRFIMVGGGIADRLPELFEQICRVNTRRFVDLEFHFPLDAIGTNSFEPGKPQEALDYMDRFRWVLRDMQQERLYGSELHFLGELDTRLDGNLKIFLNWYLSAEEMIRNLMPERILH